jgi:hypothetical protein
LSDVTVLQLPDRSPKNNARKKGIRALGESRGPAKHVYKLVKYMTRFNAVVVVTSRIYIRAAEGTRNNAVRI